MFHIPWSQQDIWLGQYGIPNELGRKFIFRTQYIGELYYELQITMRAWVCVVLLETSLKIKVDKPDYAKADNKYMDIVEEGLIHNTINKK